MGLTRKESEILDSIKVPSEDNPEMPEFPPGNPEWPSTPIKKIDVKGFPNVFLKDESVNPTGTHKDRMAWEIIVTYRQLLLSKKRGNLKKLPQMSIISSGSAAFAIQTLLKKHGLPNLKVLVDHNLDGSVKKSLERIGCELYETDLSKKELFTDDILKLTNNADGIDITSDDSLGPFTVFYDWMAYDIINQSADYVFIPYGTGHLYENIVNVAVREGKTKNHDKRFSGNPKKIRKCNFIGATTNNPLTKADKLYSPHLPFVHFDKKWIKMAISNGFIGPKSDVCVVRERFLGKAMKTAESNGIDCEASGIAGLAMMLQMRGQINRNKKMLIINTGKTKYR